ncbi:MAG TPA: hypothetical protein DEQ47_04310 [Solibacterales bacterium]|nr:hypothetical protein [Bryobacterales bacterium]
MPETLDKLRPDRDLLCYFLRPSAIAALSETSAAGFTVSGCWRQQFDWAVVEWNRDNTFEHPSLRNLPDGDLSGLTLSYIDQRNHCIPLDSNLYPTIDWPYLRIWLDSAAGDTLHRVRLRDYATPVTGSYAAATAVFQLVGPLTAGDYIELAWDPFSSEHYNYQIVATDTVSTALANLAGIINSLSTVVAASVSGSNITLTLRDATSGANGNRRGVYGSVSGSRTASWSPPAQTFAGGTSPSAWQVTLPFNNLVDFETGLLIPTASIRKMRWTFSADLQPATYSRSEFSVSISNWTVTGINRAYAVAGPGSRRIENSDSTVIYSGNWVQTGGNFSGGSITASTTQGSRATLQYTFGGAHQLFIGTRRAPNTATMVVNVDGVDVLSKTLFLAGEDVLLRILAATLPAGTHLVTVTHGGVAGSYLYFDFLDIIVPAAALPTFPASARTTLATDWDTDHSIALAPERTAWLIHTLGFKGRANHYVGALWFSELTRAGQQYASAACQFQGTAAANASTTLSISGTQYIHLHLVGDTTANVVKALELQINNGSTGIWALAVSTTLTVTSRAMGVAGNAIPIAVSSTQDPATGYSVTVASATLLGGIDGQASGIAFQDTTDPANLGWRTDLTAMPRTNRAVRDWSRSFFRALAAYGIQATAAFSTELQFADPSLSAGVAQRYPDGAAVALNTPAIQTNFSPLSLAYWQQVYLEMAGVMSDAGQTPFLQFGEVQWWYFPNAAGMPFYDDFTKQQYQSAYGTPLPVLTGAPGSTGTPQQTTFLSGLIGQFTQSLMQFVRTTSPAAVFEVLYPLDVNSSALNAAVNLPSTYWTPAALQCLKTESFGFTSARNLDQCRTSVRFPFQLGFARSQSSHLVGISDPTWPWRKEAALGTAENVESVVLFALDQFCLIGYAVQTESQRRAFFSA